MKKNEKSKQRKVVLEIASDSDDESAHTHFLACARSKVDVENNTATSHYDSDDYINDYVVRSRL